MINNSQQPQKDDAILDGKLPSTKDVAVLGGLDGVKLRLQNRSLTLRIAAVEEALNYGEQGLDLVIQCLQDQSLQIQKQAYLLLNPYTETKVKQAVTAFEAEFFKQGSTDYTRLRDLLASGQWQEADQETARVMLAVAQREKEGLFLAEEPISKFPCQDLHAIDSLWVKYSNGRFGFSVQNQIYKSCKGNRFFRDSIENEFGDIVGWRPGARWLNDYDNITFDLTAPVGHLPVKGGWYWGRRTWELFKNVKFSVYLSCYVGCNLFSRLDSCEL
ncbi:MAG: GUN4 domain-containing protein [Cuspidothrix sp.]